MLLQSMELLPLPVPLWVGEGAVGLGARGCTGVSGLVRRRCPVQGWARCAGGHGQEVVEVGGGATGCGVVNGPAGPELGTSSPLQDMERKGTPTLPWRQRGRRRAPMLVPVPQPGQEVPPDLWSVARCSPRHSHFGV